MNECVEVLKNTITKVISLEQRSSMTFLLSTQNVTMKTTLLDPSPRTYLANTTANLYVASGVEVDAIYFFNSRNTRK
jgi:hypothetical protein